MEVAVAVLEGFSGIAVAGDICLDSSEERKVADEPLTLGTAIRMKTAQKDLLR